jgi:hypothetical protein
VSVGTINQILTALTVVVTGSMLVQTAVATYTQGVNAMAVRERRSPSGARAACCAARSSVSSFGLRSSHA